jgi:hypothetical protein
VTLLCVKIENKFSYATILYRNRTYQTITSRHKLGLDQGEIVADLAKGEFKIPLAKKRNMTDLLVIGTG